MLSFEGVGILSEKRELQKSKEKGGGVWRRLFNLAYMGGMAELVVEDEKLYQSAAVGQQIKVAGILKPGFDGKGMLVVSSFAPAK